MQQNALLERTDVWREGKWLDLWSVVHVLSGMSFGFGMHLFPWEPSASVVIVLVLLIAYEMFEVIAEIEETPTNRFMDVVTGMVGFLPVYFLLVPHMTHDVWYGSFAMVLSVNIGMSVIGWMESRKAAALEAKLRTELARERAYIKERRSRLRSRIASRRASVPPSSAQ